MRVCPRQQGDGRAESQRELEREQGRGGHPAREHGRRAAPDGERRPEDALKGGGGGGREARRALHGERVEEAAERPLGADRQREEEEECGEDGEAERAAAR